MKVIDKQVYYFSEKNKPVVEAESGEVLIFKTEDCFSGQITREDIPSEEVRFDSDINNPAAGPVVIRGAEPGDIIAVDIIDIKTDKTGVVTVCNYCGPLCDSSEERLKIVKLEDRKAPFNDIEMMIDPMIGVIGTTPCGEDISTEHPGKHGGNMDCKLIKKGSRVYLPVYVKGALLQMGDVHALMGDGELCGTGIETGAEIVVRISLIKNTELNWPLVETDSHWYVNTCGESYNEALKPAAEEMRRLLEAASGWDGTDIFMYLSLKGDVGINQACTPCPIDMTLRLGIDKNAKFAPLVKE